MPARYLLETHKKYPHFPFAFQDAKHYVDFHRHTHDFGEIFFVMEGQGVHKVLDYSYTLNKGDVFVIQGEVEHAFCDVKNLKLVNLIFDQHNPIFDHPNLGLMPGYQALFHIGPQARRLGVTMDYAAKLTLNESEMSKVTLLLDEVRTEYLGGRLGFELVISTLLQTLIVRLARTYQGNLVQTNTSTLALSRALIFIEQNMSDHELKVENVSAAACVGTRQLERLFKRYFAMSPAKYIKQQRLALVERLLLSQSYLSVQKIADQAGFSDSNYLAKSFRYQYGVSPSVFRQENNQYLPCNK